MSFIKEQQAGLMRYRAFVAKLIRADKRYRALVAEWAALLGVPPPDVEICDDEEPCRARYIPEDKRIIMPARFCDDHNSTDDVLIHEFAHYLDVEHGPDPFVKGPAHGPSFIEALHGLTEMVYVDARRYQWHLEYQHIVEWAVEQELSEPTRRAE